MYTQSQGHGFEFENIIRKNVFKLESKKNDTNTFDISKEQNHMDNLENISIKTTGSKTLCMGNILSFFNYDFSSKITIIVLKYKQCDNMKVISKIYEINFNKECFETLFGQLDQNDVENYVKYIKSIPHGQVDMKVREKYKKMKTELQSSSNCKIKINPKVDSKNQRRVQCSISNFEKTLEKFIYYEDKEMLRNVKLDNISSNVRLRH